MIFTFKDVNETCFRLDRIEGIRKDGDALLLFTFSAERSDIYTRTISLYYDNIEQRDCDYITFTKKFKLIMTPCIIISNKGE